MRKWKRYNAKIKSLDDLMNCLSRHGGIWVCRGAYGRYENAGWVMSYQLNYVLNQIKLGNFWWTERMVAK